MNKLISLLVNKKIEVPDELIELLNSCKSYKVFDTVDELNAVATNGAENNYYEVKYDIPGKGEFTEAVVHRVKNGISANYTEPYMRRRDPKCMLIADERPTNKDRYVDRFGETFDRVKGETIEWVNSGRDGAQCGFILRSTPMRQVRDIAEAGAVMPQKSTYFYPKPLSGLVFHLFW